MELRDEDNLADVVEALGTAGFEGALESDGGCDTALAGLVWALQSGRGAAGGGATLLAYDAAAPAEEQIRFSEQLALVLERLGCPEHLEPEQVISADAEALSPVVLWAVRRLPSADRAASPDSTIRAAAAAAAVAAPQLAEAAADADPEAPVAATAAAAAAPAAAELAAGEIVPLPSAPAAEALRETQTVGSAGPGSSSSGQEIAENAEVPEISETSEISENTEDPVASPGEEPAERAEPASAQSDAADVEAEDLPVSSTSSSLEEVEDLPRSSTSRPLEEAEDLPASSSSSSREEAEDIPVSSTSSSREEVCDGDEAAEAAARQAASDKQQEEEDRLAVLELRKEAAAAAAGVEALKCEVAAAAESLEALRAEAEEARRYEATLAAQAAKAATVEARMPPEKQTELEKLAGLLERAAELQEAEARFKSDCRAQLTALRAEEALWGGLGLRGEPYSGGGKRAEVARLAALGEIMTSLEAAHAKEAARQRQLAARVAAQRRALAGARRWTAESPTLPELAQYALRLDELWRLRQLRASEIQRLRARLTSAESSRNFLKKEAGVLNSIAETFEEAFGDRGSRGEFLRQFDGIVKGVEQSLAAQRVVARQHEVHVKQKLAEREQRTQERAMLAEALRELHEEARRRRFYL